ncbi:MULTISPECIES: hypothetical protein [unclassified Ruegeria]|uniref:hypothetical protein n=1 Tax=unclassified Ruegeria TaxID=2625375 RepID=UPI0014877A9F|nr:MULTISPECIES: hypothetical protein [unclassified Ruegeria]
MADVSRRDPNIVMRLARLGSMHQSRLSFMRILTRRLARENWRFERAAFDIDSTGVGHAIYTAHGPDRSYSLIAYAHDLPPEKRSDRVIAEAWDATFTLFDGVPTAEDIERLSHNIPVQEAGRVSETELSVSRANRSVRLWEHVVNVLAEGRQPSYEKIAAVGYLMRTTAVYGSGKLGAADREMIADRPEFRAPFQVEMLSVYLTRWFVVDLVQHMAKARAALSGTQAAELDAGIARSIGIGNSTGLGMAPFLLNHPRLFNNWITAREDAIQAVRNVQWARDEEIAQFHDILLRNIQLIESWQSQHPVQMEKLAVLGKDIALVKGYLSRTDLSMKQPWDALYSWSEEALSLEGQEWIASLILEPYGALVDKFAKAMASDDEPVALIAGATQIGSLRAVLEDVYRWAIDTDWTVPTNMARAWYISEEKQEPRLGQRFEEPIEEYEQPLAPGRDAAVLYQALTHWPDEVEVADFLLENPEHRHTLRRIQVAGSSPYAEIRDNTISNSMLPIDMLRCKLSFFGATKFDPRSDRWVRICMYGNAPLPYELSQANADFWVFPSSTETTA